MKSVVKKLASVKLTRSEFLTYVGVVFLGILGIPSLLKLVSDVSPKSNTNTKRIVKKPAPHTFGSGAYGV